MVCLVPTLLADFQKPVPLIVASGLKPFRDF